MLLLTCQYFTNSGASSQPVPQNPISLTGGQTREQLQQQQIRRIRNKNPNCNHNSSTVFYQPHYNNVKYDDHSSTSKKEEVLRKVFFKESSKIDDLKQYNPIG